MFRNKILPVTIILIGIVSLILFFRQGNQSLENNLNRESEGGLEKQLHPLSIEYMRSQEYSGSDLTIEQTLDPGSNYNRYIVSYKSEGLKIYALLTVPQSNKPVDGFPAIVFNHGYIPPSEYTTTGRYIAYTDAFSSNGYIVLKPDYRGHGNSEGQAQGGYGSPAYTIDVLNALSSIKKYKDTNPDRIGMWGHSMGGFITLRSMVVSKDIKAGVIWGGVVASYEDLLNNWRRRTISPSPIPGNTSRSWRQNLVREYGEPESNRQFWNSISANSYLNDVSGPLQLHHGQADSSVPVRFSENLNEQMKSIGKTVELYIYPGDDHNISTNLSLALQRSVEFFDKYLK